VTEIVKQTPLVDKHQAAGGKLVQFGGWELPAQYQGVIAEHKAVRNKAGLFDVSHMGEIKVTGERAVDLLQKVLSNDLTQVAVNQAQYTMMCNQEGGVVDDLLVYRLGENEYLLVVNAVNSKKDYDWIKKRQVADVEIIDQSEETAQLALQGPTSEQILQQLTTADLAEIDYYWFKQEVEVAGVEALVSRTGYTGEDGFEIYCSAEEVEKLWEEMLAVGSDYGLVPVGLGARDTLRLEACLPLYGQEVGPGRNPLAAGLGKFVAFDKATEFIGQSALEKIKKNGCQQKLVGIKMIERGVPRSGYTLVKENKEIGEVTSGTYAPSLEQNVGLGYVDAEQAEVGTELQVKIRDRKCKAEVVDTPFYK